MFSSRTIYRIAILALIAASWSAYSSLAHSASLSSTQILQRSILATRSALSAHSESSVHLAIGGETSEQITARTSVDCTGARSTNRCTSGIRAAIGGTFVIGKGLPQLINMRYIFLSSGSSTGSNISTVFWERDATRANRWRKVSTVVREPAYTAFLAADSCPTGGAAFRLAQGMPQTRLAPPAVDTSLGRLVWAIAGTSGSGIQKFSFRILVDRSTYRLDGVADTYVETINGRVVARNEIVTTYSRYGVPVTIKAPAALALHEAK
jgi:hypothetical protein